MKDSFCVVSYNIQHGSLSAFDWKHLTEPVRLAGASLLGMQEVDIGTHRSGGRDTVTGVREALRWPEGRFVQSMDYNGGYYGNALFASEPFLAFDTMPLKHIPGHEPRSIGHAILRLENGRRLHFLNTHLTVESAAGREIQFKQIAALLATIPDEDPFLVTGDWNTEKYADFAPLLGDGSRVALANALHPDRLPGERQVKTFINKPIAIDNIAYDKRLLTLTDIDVIKGNWSDHYPLYASFSCK